MVIDYDGKEQKLGWKRWRFINSHLNWNIAKVHEMLCKAFQSHLNLGTFADVDEARIPCGNGQCPFRSYNPQKPDKWAMESLTLSDSSKYLRDFTNPTEEAAPTAFQWLLKCGELLKRRGIKHHITADKRFSNLEQAEKLKEMEVGFTICCKVTNPTFLFRDGLAQDLPKWRVHMATKGGLVAESYHQKRKLNLLTSWFTVKEHHGSKREERLPILQHYDDTKRWTDQFDQLVSSYHFDHSHSDWKITLLLGWFEWARTNAFILYGLVYGDHMTHRYFLFQCAHALFYACQ